MSEPQNTPEPPSTPNSSERSAPSPQSAPPPPGPLGVDLKPRLDLMDDGQLAKENVRAELAKLMFEFEEQRSWRWKVLFTSIIAPFGSVILLLVGWYGSHVAERRHQVEDVYTAAAKQLASSDPAVRLSAVKTLDQYMVGSDTSWLAQTSERIFASRTSRDLTEERSRTTMALLIGSLLRENDPSVLDAIADATEHHPEEAADPVISMNKTAAVTFARAAGGFAGLSILHGDNALSFKDEDVSEGVRDKVLDDIDIFVLRTGSPFQASTRFNPRFSPKDMLVNGRTCQFNEIFDNRRTLTMGVGVNTVLRRQTPDIQELKAAMENVISSAATLERSSYILGKLIDKHRNIIDETKSAPASGFVFDLFGTAVIIGKPDDPAAIVDLRKRGGYFNSPEYYEHNPGCQL